MLLHQLLVDGGLQFCDVVLAVVASPGDEDQVRQSALLCVSNASFHNDKRLLDVQAMQVYFVERPVAVASIENDFCGLSIQRVYLRNRT